MKLSDPFLTTKEKWFCTAKAEKCLLLSVDLAALLTAYLLSSAVLFLAGYGPLENGRMADSLFRQNFVELRMYLGLMAVTVIIFLSKGHYSTRRPYWNEFREVLQFSAVLAVAEAAIVFFGKWQFSRATLLLNWMMVPFFILTYRTALKVTLLRMGGWARPMVIVGGGENAIETALAFADERLMGYSLIAFLIPDGAPVEGSLSTSHGGSIPSLPLGPSPDFTLKCLGNPHVVLALEQGGIDSNPGLVQELSRRHRRIQIVPSIRGLPLYGMEVNHFFAHEVLLLNVRNNLARRLPRFVKRLFDIVVSTCILLVGLPALTWIAMRVRASGGPIFYGHPRQGQGNRRFACYKFRTMAPDADRLLSELLARDPEARAEWERDFKLKNDPRITPIGHFLRRTSLDELPQLWNVLKGEMSLVGPRPIVTAELERYGNQLEYYLEAKPGLTGLWQISGRNDISYDSRVYLDAWYVKNWSLFNDIVILLRTFKVIFRREGAY
jgi:undecaprenyl-phosphate galactose phosphotransferase